MTVHTEQFYDDYNVAAFTALPAAYRPGGYSTLTKGLPTVSRVLVLGTAQYLWNAVYYDDRGNTVREYRQHYKGGGTAGANNYDDVATEYSFTRQALASTRRHYASGSLSVTVKTENTYDHRDRPVDTWKTLNPGTGTRTLIARSVYNEVGQLYRRQLHSTNGTTFADSVKYTYNPRGWVLSTASPKFRQTLLYEDTTEVAMRQFNGNISRQSWRRGTGTVQSYAYTYDRLNRMLTGTGTGSKSETVTYDRNGNIATLKRDTDPVWTYGYTAAEGNRLRTITGGSGTYLYDLNGNMTRDARQGINITYNELNLPASMSGSATATYTYDATGRKLRSVMMGITTDYIDGIEWEGTDLSLIHMEEGRILPSGIYDYVLRDHLGNTRSGFASDATGSAKFVADYRPFGTVYNQGSIPSPKNRYLYNGKELQEGSEYYDYGARFYDPYIGRWGSIDPLGENHFNLTQYNYVMNNPMSYIDLFGLDTLSAENITPEDWYNFNAEEDVIKIPEVEITSNKGGTDWKGITSDVLTAFEVGNKTKEELLDFAVRNNFKSNNTRQAWERLTRNQQIWRQKRTLGKAGYTYLRGVKIVGRGVTGANVVITALQTGGDIVDGRYYAAGARLTVSGIAAGAAFIPVVGWGVSIGIGVADAVWGDEFYNYVEDTFGN
ncbi:RHS repeat-associated core domain-containing protein [Parapedobacter koreensis]|uniref:RHS repeat-associated core domain-containing protein n=2 Tax=Parapedobacter koreensis TaxID=332977 RepID=A0A1H7UNB8_9SPHI|nr:RHS repeat-associated core domain-containing protein [Parapedobacter koreensis]